MDNLYPLSITSHRIFSAVCAFLLLFCMYTLCYYHVIDSRIMPVA